MFSRVVWLGVWYFTGVGGWEDGIGVFGCVCWVCVFCASVLLCVGGVGFVFVFCWFGGDGDLH